MFLVFVMLIEMAGMHLGTAVFATESQNTEVVVSENTTEVSVGTDTETEVQAEGNSVQDEAEDVNVAETEEKTSEAEQVEAEQELIEDATIELTCQDFSSAAVSLAWTLEDISGIDSFAVYRDGVQIATRKAGSALSYAYSRSEHTVRLQ